MPFSSILGLQAKKDWDDLLISRKHSKMILKITNLLQEQKHTKRRREILTGSDTYHKTRKCK
jgi:hypothetical protein